MEQHIHQLKAVSSLDQVKIKSVLCEKRHENLVLNSKDMSQLQEIVTILEPFAEATDMTQGDKTVTISCVVPILLSLNKHLQCRLSSASTVTSFVKTLQQSLLARFSKLFSVLGIDSPGEANRTNSLSFDSSIFLIAPALDPAYAFNWLDDHPGGPGEKEALRFKITG